MEIKKMEENPETFKEAVKRLEERISELENYVKFLKEANQRANIALDVVMQKYIFLLTGGGKSE